MAKGIPIEVNNLLGGFIGKSVELHISSQSGELWHKLGPVTITSLEMQKSTGMKNSPEKRVKDGKAYTPTMVAIVFESARLVAVLEDVKFLARHRGVRLQFDNYSVDMVEYEHEL